MKKIFKTTGVAIVLITFCTAGIGVYFYLTNDMIRASINNYESKLYYFPTKELADLVDFNVDEIELEVDDHVMVYNYHFRPNTDRIQAKIFLIHGAGGNATTYKDLIRPLVENEFDVYAVDWRGYGKSKGIPNYKNVLTDTERGFLDYQQRTKNDTIKTIVYGMSLGGQVAIKITLDNRENVDALVLDGCVPSAQQMAIDYAPVDFLRQRAKEHPERFNQEYVAIRDISKIENTPKLIIHSIQDSEVQYKHGKNLFTNAKEPKTFWKTDTKHIMTLANYPNEAIEKIKELIR
ncbi:MAG: alpha/beta fold hydrolase [Bacteroidota bacterium]